MILFIRLTTTARDSPSSVYEPDFHNETILSEAMDDTVGRIPEAFEWNLDKEEVLTQDFIKVWENKPHWLEIQ